MNKKEYEALPIGTVLRDIYFEYDYFVKVSPYQSEPMNIPRFGSLERVNSRKLNFSYNYWDFEIAPKSVQNLITIA